MRPLQHGLSAQSLLRATAALLASLASCVAPADGVVDHSSVQAHNQRPFIGRDTHTTADSFFELEAGVQSDPGEEAETPMLIKFGAGPRTELYGGTSPYRKVDKNGLMPDGSGWGDTVFGVRHRFRDADMYTPAMAFQLETKLPTARESKGLGSGEMDFLGTFIAEQNYEGTDVAGSYRLGILGEADGDGMNHEHTLAVQGRRPLNQQVAGFAEASFIYQPEIDRDELAAMAGLSFIIDDFTLFNVGLRVGISHDAPDVQLLVDLTRTLGLLDFEGPARAGN
jgi:hypothetical protein